MIDSFRPRYRVKLGSESIDLNLVDPNLKVNGVCIFIEVEWIPECLMIWFLKQHVIEVNNDRI